MRRRVMGFMVLVCTIFIFLSPVYLHAKGMYVMDWIVITLRSAPNETSLAMGTASTNERVEILEEGKGWMRIQTKDGKEGWVAGRFLSAQPPKTLYLRQMEQKLTALQVDNMRLRGLISGHTSSGVASPGAAQPGRQGAVVLQEVAFADCPKLKGDYDKLMSESQEYSKKRSIIDAENNRLKTSERIIFTFMGGIFIILGIVIGLFVQMVRARPKKPGYKF
jgi:SH3 domain protein